MKTVEAVPEVVEIDEVSLLLPGLQSLLLPGFDYKACCCQALITKPVVARL